MNTVYYGMPTRERIRESKADSGIDFGKFIGSASGALLGAGVGYTASDLLDGIVRHTNVYNAFDTNTKKLISNALKIAGTGIGGIGGLLGGRWAMKKESSAIDSFTEGAEALTNALTKAELGSGTLDLATTMAAAAPVIGAVSGGLGDSGILRGGIRGLGAGAGAALGSNVAAHFTDNNVLSTAAGGLVGGALGYKLLAAMTKNKNEEAIKALRKGDTEGALYELAPSQVEEAKEKQKMLETYVREQMALQQQLEAIRAANV